MSLVDALSTLSDYRQFILWDGVPDVDGNGNKTVIKKPINPHTGRVHDAHDSSIWLDLNSAVQAAQLLELNVGFVFTENDPLFFIDIDKQFIGGRWSTIATDVCARFDGAFIELSQSGTGLHVIGVGKVAAAKRLIDSKPKAFSLYTEKRFVALTGKMAKGSARTDHTAALNDLVASYLVKQNAVDGEIGWTDTPVPEWSGPEDDQELINKMLQSKSAGAIFGKRASLLDLWLGNDEKLSVAFPDSQGIRAFDHSSADASLCQHLAFWTGKNCERMDRIFRMSALYREKWEEREDYRINTIEHAVGLCRDVYSSCKVKKEIVRNETIMASSTDTTNMRDGFQFLTASQQIEYFKGCTYVQDIHRIFTPDGHLLKPEQFKAVYGGYVFSLDAMNDKNTKNAWEAFTESQAVKFPKVHAVCFRPEIPPNEIVEEENRRLVNTYVPIETARKQGDPEPFLDLLKKLLPVQKDRDILLAYMAAVVQHPGVKFQWTPLLQGVEGNGKTLVIDVVARSVGYRYTHLPNASDLAGNGQKFSLWLQNKLFIGVEEIYVADKREALDAIKPMITNSRLEIQGKGADQVTGDNRANFLMTSNHKDAVMKTRRDRRFCVFYTAQQNEHDLVRAGWVNPDMTGTTYFPNLYKWLRADGYAIVNNFLREYQIPEQLNPATLCTRAPYTSSTDEALMLALGGVEQEILEAVAEGRYGFTGGWVSSWAFNSMLERRHDTKRIPINKRKEILENLGYIPHPSLPDGRTTKIIPTEGTKPRLYVKAGNLALNLTVPADIAERYIKDQEGTVSAGPNGGEIFQNNS